VSGDTDVKDVLNDPPINGYSEVICCPGSTNSTFHTLGVGVEFDAGPGVSSMIPCLVTKPLPSDGFSIGHGLRLRAHQDTPGGFACLPKQDANGRYTYELTLDPKTAGVTDYEFNFEARNIGNPATAGGTTIAIRMVLDDGTVLTENFVVPGSHAIDNVPIDAMTAGATSDVVRTWSFTTDDPDPGSNWVVSLTTVGVAVQFSLVERSATAFRILNTSELDSLAETDSERTAALSLLCTYMGSTLADGGRISCARLGMGLTPMRAPAGDVYRYLAELPLYNQDYALRDGIYGWWLPDSVQEYFYTPYRDPRSDDLSFNSLIVAAMHRDQPEQGIRLRTVQCLEVITRSRLYAVDVAPVNPAYDVIISAVKILPAVTENPKHSDILSKALKSVGGWLSKPTNWIKALTTGSSLIKKIFL
jgi:hypothetical protein